ncbi:uncharacterized protein (DUF1810 family) [Nakamurella sp. UYEF19]|uniref:DUF1810 domain-containing protein n=1 Tax=Nakamurella sp. UYEF19 TaxID=1756392 RepID=UPI003395E7EE
MSDPLDLSRFVTAQDGGRTYAAAVAELRRGRKTSHWMWFVFPQIAGLGNSAMSRRYAISGLEEGTAYLQHPVLGPRLLEVSNIVVHTEGATAQGIFGGIDARKLHSCVTLFRRIEPAEAVFETALDRFFDGRPDPMTIRLIDGA